VDSTHYYQLEIKRNAGGAGWFLIKRDGNNWVQLASGSLDYSAGNWVRLRLSMNGNTLRAESSADGFTYSQLGNAVDGSYSAGRFGVRAWHAVAYFNDLLVQSM
jgi:hypothetical protein